MLQVRFLCIGVVGLLLTAMTASADLPSFTGLGDLPGGEFRSTAGGVSADGAVVVGWSVFADDPWGGSGYSEGFRWQNGVMSGIGFLPSNPPPLYSGAKAVSADGSVIVGDGSSLAGTNEPFRWENGSLTSLGRIPGAWNNAHLTTGVSGDGQRVVGWGYNTVRDESQAWLWDHGTMMGLGDMMPGAAHIFSNAFGISSDGEIVVGAANSPDGSQAFQWRNGTMSGLGFLRSSPFPTPDGDVGPSSVANAASTDGSVIVGAANSDASGPEGSEAFRWFDGTMVGLGDLPGGEFRSGARALSGDGSTIVGEATTDNGTAAFIWDSAHGMRDLQSVLAGEFGLDLTGWTLTTAAGISADGTVIVGNGINPNGDYEGFRAVLPEPATFFLALLMAAAVSRKRRKECRTDFP